MTRASRGPPIVTIWLASPETVSDIYAMPSSSVWHSRRTTVGQQAIHCDSATNDNGPIHFGAMERVERHQRFELEHCRKALGDAYRRGGERYGDLIACTEQCAVHDRTGVQCSTDAPARHSLRVTTLVAHPLIRRRLCDIALVR